MLIYREKILDRIDKLYQASAITGLGLEPVLALCDIKKLICMTTEVDAAPVKHGRWIGYPGDEHIECSICKQQYFENDLYIGGNDFPKYCPNCGAKMDLKEENK